ncbi:MAG: 30S ribosomal protein S16 [Synergistaceae bacterium]|jgi:small subunit ribosomal protein S16|uniref:30S ribosomal protein S16 n=1 Tax=Aminivibrio sp. TaxID=1872489 RepID=UPI002A2235C7|nr:30S ribosomal protein S16 [Synergistaceae bacterium]MDD3391016.1 30S ribosomal protein S16 [Synergistaceae bacterium]MDD3688551.1 30S ribosomal protein S16 [Synergistaceae bacterium]MDD4020263.1 30S ribosomal protein S16 [Synergistaceae bacterium]MDD4611685.1 30S ribosomal protein S16 [Synergistaceae bacterium]
MAVRIRLARHGRKKAPFYRLVVADSRSPRDGRFIELLGTYDPMTDPAKVTVNEERAVYWLTVGATASETARGLLKKTGVWEKFEAGKKQAE